MAFLNGCEVMDGWIAPKSGINENNAPFRTVESRACLSRDVLLLLGVLVTR